MSKKMIVRFDGDMDLTEKQIDEGLDKIRMEYNKISLMPEKTRRTKRIMDRLVKLKMLEGLLLGFKRRA